MLKRNLPGSWEVDQCEFLGEGKGGEEYWRRSRHVYRHKDGATRWLCSYSSWSSYRELFKPLREDTHTMTRVDSALSRGLDAAGISKLAQSAGIPVRYRRARCEHGRTREQDCASCEGGYVYDMHPFAYLPRVCVAAVTDDGEDVVYIPIRYEALVSALLSKSWAEED